MSLSDRVIVTIGENVRQKGLSPLDALEMARLLAAAAMEADEVDRGNQAKQIRQWTETLNSVKS